MAESSRFDFHDLLSMATRIQKHGVPVKPMPVMACTWSRDPGTGRLGCHWVTALPRD